MSRINVPATPGHGPLSAPRLLIVGIAASAAAIVALVFIAQPFGGNEFSSSPTSTALAPSTAGVELSGSMVVNNALSAHEAAIEAQFGPMTAPDLRSAELARALAEHDALIGPFVGAVVSRSGELTPEIQRAIAEHDNLIETFVS
jgi:hypothetical protein